MPSTSRRRFRCGACSSAAVVAAIASLPSSLLRRLVLAGRRTGPAPVLSRADPYAAGQHRGIDVGAAAGDAVRAPRPGRLLRRPRTVRRPRAHDPDRRRLRRDAAPARLGRVARGSRSRRARSSARVGESERRGHDRPHVHLGVRVAAEPNGYVDPLGCCRRVRRRAAPAAAPPPRSPLRRTCRHRREGPAVTARRTGAAGRPGAGGRGRTRGRRRAAAGDRAAGNRAAGLHRSRRASSASPAALRHVRPVLARTASSGRADTGPADCAAAPGTGVAEHRRRGRACASRRRADVALGAASPRVARPAPRGRVLRAPA